jgi:hypothetical protein
MRLAREHSLAGGPVLADCPKQDVRNLLKIGFCDSFGDGSLYSARYCSVWQDVIQLAVLTTVLWELVHYRANTSRLSGPQSA